MRNKELLAAIGAGILFIVAVVAALSAEWGLTGLAIGLAFVAAGDAAGARDLADRQAVEEANDSAERIRAAEAKAAARGEGHAEEFTSRQASSD